MYAFLSFHQCLDKLKVILKKFHDANSNILSIPEFISTLCFPCSSISKESPALQEIWDRFLDWEDPMEEKWQPTPVFLPGKSHGQRSQADYMASQESDMTYQLTTTTTILTFGSGSFSSLFAYVCQIIFIKWQTLYVQPEKKDTSSVRLVVWDLGLVYSSLFLRSSLLYADFVICYMYFQQYSAAT